RLYARISVAKPRGASLLGDDVRDPSEVGFARRALREYAVAIAVTVVSFPEHAGLRETRLDEQLAQLGKGPKPPVVGEGALDLRAVGEVEMNVAEDAAGHRFELGLLPDICEAVDLRFFLREVRGVGTAERIQEENAVG